MNAVIVLLALSALIGLALGTSFSWIAIVVSGVALGAISAAALQVQGFSAFWGIAIIVACLTVNQMAYLAGALRRSKGYFRNKPTRNQADVATTTLPVNTTSNSSPGSPEGRLNSHAPI
jgi:hypothetical protein